MFALIEAGAVAQYPYSLQDLQAANPNTSFPPNDDAALEEFHVFRVYKMDPPTYDVATQKIEEGIPVFVEDAQRWVQTWTVVALSAEEIAANEAAAKADVEVQARQLLEDCDWADLPSVRNTSVTPHLVNTADFDTYRLALRVIVLNPPVTVDPWPTRPEAVWSAV